MLNDYFRRLMDATAWNSYAASFADPSRTVLHVETYTYAIDETDLTLDDTAGGQDFPLVMDSDSDFVAMYLSGGVTISDQGDEAPAVTRIVEWSPSLNVQITDQSAGKTWFDFPTPLPLIAGAGGFPFLVASPRVIRPRSTLSINAQAAASGVIFDGFFFAIGGSKIYYAGATG
jgi:hypothetical protein